MADWLRWFTSDPNHNNNDEGSHSDTHIKYYVKYQIWSIYKNVETFCMGHNVQWVINIHNLEVLKTSTLKTSLRLVNISVLHIIGLSDTLKWLHIGYCKCISQTIQYKSTSDINRILILIALYNGAILSWKRTK
jgi:hypothetical protein